LTPKMADIFISRLGLVAGVLLTLVGVVASLRPPFMFRARRSADAVAHLWFSRTFWLIVTAGTGVAILLVNLPGARLLTVHQGIQAWGLVVVGILQVALGGAWLFAARSPGWAPRMTRSTLNQWMLPLVPLATGTVWLALAVALPGGMTGTAVKVDQQMPLPTETRQSAADAEARADASAEAPAEAALIGIVQDGAFLILSPAPLSGTSARLTGIAMQEARSPESKELDLAPYEGCAIAVRGHDGGGWIYSAEVIDQGGPLLTALVQHAYGR
jgi:hypothetical protein